MAIAQHHLRAYTPHDALAVMRLERLCFGMQCPIDPRELGEGIEGLVCSWHGVTVSYLLTSTTLLPGELCLLSLAVHPEFRRCGYATSMLRRLQWHAQLVGMPIVGLVGADNWPMRAALVRLGFSEVVVFPRIHRFDWDPWLGEHAYVDALV